MLAYQERVVKEKEELDAKLDKLKDFCFGTNDIFHKLDEYDKNLLRSQYDLMNEYSKVLTLRISRF